MGYTDVEFVKAIAQIRYDELGFNSESDYDSFISQLIDHASSLVDDYCGRSFSEPVPQTVKLVTALIVTNILQIILQRKINPTVQATNVVMKVVEPESFTDGLKMLLDPYKVLTVERG